MKRFGNAPVWTFIVIGIIIVFVYGMGSLGVANKEKSDACTAKGGIISYGNKCVQEVK